MNLRRLLKIVSLVLVLVAAGSLWLSCASGTTSTGTSQSQVATVTRGNLTTSITATGNLAFSTHDDLVFHITGQVAAVNVKVGDNITKGQVLAALDTTDLDEAVDTANLSVKSAQIDLQSAQNAQSNIKDQELAVQTAQLGLQTAQQAVSSITTAQINLDTATNNLNKLSYPYTFTTFNLNVPAAILSVHDAQLNLSLAKDGLSAAAGTAAYTDAWLKFQKAMDDLTDAQGNLLMGTGIDNFLAVYSQSRGGSSSNQTAFAVTDYFSLKAAQLALDTAQANLNQTTVNYKTGLDQANLTLTKALQTLSETKTNVQTGLDKANINLDNARNNLKKAQENLAKATITAPYNGIVTVSNVTGGQQINSGQVVFSVADPAQLEADVLVNEVDIPWVTLGGAATLQVDAASAINLPAKVTKVSPTATVSSGVVNYTVTISLPSVVISQAGQAGQTPAAQPTPTRTPGQTPAAQSGQSAQSRTASRAAFAGIPSSVQLRQGLSVTANLVKDQRRAVLLIPARAISLQGGNSVVQVVSGATVETRVVQTGLTDGQNTEITSGLSEGEKVVLQARTTTATTPAAGGGLRLPGGLLR